MLNTPFDNQSQRRVALALGATACLLRSRILGAPVDAVKHLRHTKLQGAMPEEVEQAIRTGYLTNEDGSKTLLVSQGGNVAKVHLQPTSSRRLAQDAIHFPLTPSSHKPSLDRVFFRQLAAILRIAFPSWTSKEALLLVLHSFFLVLRTVLSVGVAQLDGKIVRDLVSANGRGFLKGLGLWFALAIPSTYTNAMIKHLQSSISLRMRTRLTRYTHDLYVSGDPYLRYFRASQEGGLDGVDQYITSDVGAFCESASVLYGNVMKPGLDIVLFTSQLSRSLGFRGTLLMFVNYYLTARILRAVTPAFGRLAAVEARLEGEFRAGMGRIGRESEEIAFYNGGKMERTILERAYLRLIRHVNSIYKIRIAYEWTEDYVIKYLWSAAGYGLISIPYLVTRTKKSIGIQAGPDSTIDDDHVVNAVADRTEGYISSRRLLLSLADAGGRLMYAYKDLLELAGLTTRLYTLLSTLHQLPALSPPKIADRVQLSHVDVNVPSNNLIASVEGDYTDSREYTSLVRDLSLELRENEHLMITGANGVGKTAVARVLAGLWAPQGLGAEVSSPPREKVFVVPQRAYMVAGSLLDQIIYPHTYADYVSSGRTEAELMKILDLVFLAYLPAREGGWFTRKEWKDVFSGGEKQRMGLARVFYHRPRFAILDECTSAVSSDVEGRMYESLKAQGITLITISLRPSLSKYHTKVLSLVGDGTWSVTRVGEESERMERGREIADLEGKLAEVEAWETRIKELEALLGVQELEDAESP